MSSQRSATGLTAVTDRRGAPEPVVAFIGLGSNLEDRERQIRSAIAALARLPGVGLVRTSSIYESKPWGFADQPNFLNAAVQIETTLGPVQLLIALKWIEWREGRRLGRRWGPRLIDLDILLYANRRFQRPGLVIPHAQLHERAFALVPLRELWPDYHTPDGRSVDELLSRLGEELAVWSSP
ncbi:MAG: 2-amino-4-hydroxy-6-hydroxymethyldihydropteridine diphosphokinase [Chloroflexi bacterium]|nr:2-amino-4-hydroxy-6-hydroxymethyldihydropteridine diphosphokinase [Chloroflexota bacterium]